jgi:ABC-type multidrug transport system ATPase subunit
MEPVIDIRKLSKWFRGKPAVDRLSLTVPRGSIFALLGDNGAGKTTTIRMLTGLLPADSASARIVGRRLPGSATTSATCPSGRASTTG